MMDGAEPVFFGELLNFTLENMAKLMSRVVTVLHQHHDSVHIFNYEANDKRQLLRKRTKDRWKGQWKSQM